MFLYLLLYLSGKKYFEKLVVIFAFSSVSFFHDRTAPVLFEGL